MPLMSVGRWGYGCLVTALAVALLLAALHRHGHSLPLPLLRPSTDPPRPGLADLLPVAEALRAPKAAAYSSSQCYGGRSELEYHEANVCLLRNVCVRPGNWSSILFFEDPSAPSRAPKYFYNGSHSDRFPPVDFCEGPTDRLVEVRRARVPAGAAFARQPVVALGCYAAGAGPPGPNAWFGGLLRNLFPYYHAAVSLRVWDPAALRVLFAFPGAEARSDCRRSFGGSWFPMAGLMADGVSVCDAADLPQGGHVCFHNLIYGAQLWRHGAGPPARGVALGPAYWRFRNVLRWNIARLAPSDGPAAQRVVVLREADPRRRIRDGDALAGYLRRAFPGVPVAHRGLPGPPRAQLRALNEATVLIAPPSAIRCAAVLAPDNCAVVFVSGGPAEGGNSTMEVYLLQHMPWLRTFWYHPPAAGLRGRRNSSAPAGAGRSAAAGGDGVSVDAPAMARVVFGALRAVRDGARDPQLFQFRSALE